jgi:hypothetical protein
MSTKYFNFNNEADQVALEVNDTTGVVTIMGTEFDSVQAFAEFYALNRDVKADNLKNWTLVEDGSRVSFVLRAGTAGNADLTALATSLRAAGLTPEEIGRALAAVATQETTPQTAHVQVTNERHNALADFLETNREALSLLPLVAGSDLVAFVDNADLETSYFDEDYDEYVEIDEYDATENLLYSTLSEAKSLVQREYPGVPLTFAVALKTNDLSGFQTSADEVSKRFVVGELASRPELEVVTVNRAFGEPEVRTNLLTREEAFSTGQLYYVENKIIRVIG